MKQEKTFIVDTLFILLLFTLFTISLLLLVSIGAKSYQNTTEVMSVNYDTRTSISYITEKIRQNDCLISSEQTAGIFVTNLNDVETLVLTQEINEQCYYTYLYFYEGYLKELVVKSGVDLGEQTLLAGQNILKLNHFEVTKISDKLISIKLITPDNQAHSLYVSTHCETN